ILRRPLSHSSSPFPYTTLFRSVLSPLSELMATARSIASSTVRGTRIGNLSQRVPKPRSHDEMAQVVDTFNEMLASLESATQAQRSEEHTSELQSPDHLVCRLLL